MLGNLSKMRATLNEVVDYNLPFGEQELALNPLLGERLRLNFTGSIHCANCGALTKKSYSQGYCFPCCQRLASCDLCIMKPETCHFDQGTCREPEWGQSHCFQPHIVYLSNSSGLKVGITRRVNLTTRWIDQGAIQGIPLLEVSHRKLAGEIEVALKAFAADKTNWRKMLKNEVEKLDMHACRESLLAEAEPVLAAIRKQYPGQVITSKAQPVDLNYPVHQYPSKITSLNFDKQAEVDSVLLGIKGQYLLFESGVINIRKFTSYQVQMTL